MKWPPKTKRGLCRTALQVLEWELAYNVLESLQTPFDCVLWLIEQAKARLQDRLDNKGRER